jgi:hypothetical protein
MGSGTKVRLVVVFAVVLSLAGLFAGSAIGKKHPPKKHYTASGHGTYESTDQACFGAKWSGTGGWHTSYKESTTNDTADMTSDTIIGNSSYSWDEYYAAIDAQCGLRLLKGYAPSGGAFWSAGHARMGASGEETQTFKDAPTTTTKCDKSVSKKVSNENFSPGGMKLKREGASLEFTVSLDLPLANCDYSFPGQAVPGGKVGDFTEATSIKVPTKVFEHSSKVSVTISSDGKQGPKPNCGIAASSIPSGSTVKCTQTGNWQGMLTLYEGKS